MMNGNRMMNRSNGRKNIYRKLQLEGYGRPKVALSGMFFFSDHFTGRFNIVDGEGDDPLAFIF